MRISFEVFPPKCADTLGSLRHTLALLSAANPTFVSVTYGAGGSQRERSFDAIASVAEAGLGVAAHLTCVGQTTAEIDVVLERYATLGVSEVVALRGDPPGGVDGGYAAHPDGYQRTSDLVASAARRFAVNVSAYPERHPQSPSIDHDLDVLADKVEAGATKAITQMCFDNGALLRYRDRVARRGIDVAIVPGIFPIHSFSAVANFAARCGATMPEQLTARFAGLDQDAAASHDVAAQAAADQITELSEHGVEHVHVYTLNRADLALSVCERLGLVESAAV
jgi:methylenetetrahydrofolate reductase (NADPH)